MILRVIDFETRGLPPDNCQIVEVATVDLVETGDGEWTRGRMWRSFVNPGLPIPPEVSAIHHITDEMVKDAPTIDALMPTVPGTLVADIFANVDSTGVSHFAAHNSKFEKACAPWLPQPMICTYKCAIAAWPDAPSHSNQALRYWLKLKLADEAGAPHRALGDAYVTAAILRKLLSLGNTVDDMIKVSGMPAMLPKLTFGEHAMKPIAEVPTSYFEWICFKSKGPWDEDIMYTARMQLEERNAAKRARSPV
jgi:exodeoxyribonuclease X